MSGRVRALLLGALLAAPVAWLLWTRPGEDPPVEFFEPMLDEESWAELLADSGDVLEVSPSGLVRRPVPEAVAERLFALDGRAIVYDPRSYFAFAPHYRGRRKWPTRAPGEAADGYQVRTNALGMREDDEVLAEKPDVRVLVTGDSQAEGVVRNASSFTNRLEQRLSKRRPDETVECLNASLGGYSFYNYLGVLEKYAALEPDVFVMTVYGGNDFAESLLLHRFFQGQERPARRPEYWDQVLRAKEIDVASLAQDLTSLLRFKHFPQERELALDAARAVTLEIARQCRENGIGLLVVYLPPVRDAQPGLMDALPDLALALELSPQDLEISDRMAETYLAFLDEREIRFLDLRPVFRAREDALYWSGEWHINAPGHWAVARALLPRVEEILADSARAGAGR